jgi:ribosomal protein L34
MSSLGKFFEAVTRKRCNMVENYQPRTLRKQESGFRYRLTCLQGRSLAANYSLIVENDNMLKTCCCQFLLVFLV